ncbi:MAG: hypothetical protein LBF79_02735 [Dysgonamonadaceae bacterium]|jgi:uncharacterized protein (DUF608 family)|nr:hypothetical protein [Dysgonamonadaceae bacterium]
MRLISIALISVSLYAVAAAKNAEPAKNDGYPISNFALTVNASQNGNMFGEILQNTGTLGEWLNPLGSLYISIEKDGDAHKLSDFKKKKIDRTFPFVTSAYEKSPLIKSKITSRTFCPIAVNDIETSTLPVIMLELYVTSTIKETFNITVQNSNAAKEASIFFRINNENAKPAETGNISIPVSVSPANPQTIRISIAFHDSNHYSAKRFNNAKEISKLAQESWDSLLLKTKNFSDAIPNTGDTKLDRYLRWYIVPGIALTKITKNGDALTMGYRELNQRDSYWTAWLHLVLFKDLERLMIKETVLNQQPSGKIPTTILPLIERHDDLDINAFFILREARYYRLYKDKTILAEDWTSIKKAIDWLIARDKKGNGLPEQVSFWGDWKDVQGVKDRLYSPFSALVYLSALKEVVFLAEELQDSSAAVVYKAAFDKGYNFINKHVSEGGLWNGKYYCQVWKDGAINDKLLQDQTIGILFGIIPQDKANSIFNSLNAMSLTPYGIAETFPYYPETFGMQPATYHNGAVWPWLSFMDCWARIVSNRKKEAIKLVKKVANADLVKSGDWSPNEHINSLTGENLGFILQGWNAGLYGLVYFGLCRNDVNITGIPQTPNPHK